MASDPHPAPGKPASTPVPADLATISQARLTWYAFCRHKPAVVSLGFIVVMYIIALFVEVFAPGDPYRSDRQAVFHPPQAIHFLDRSENGTRFAPHVLGQVRERDPVTLQTRYTVDPEHRIYLRFFTHGPEYRLWGLFPGTLRFFGATDPTERVHFLGADRLGRDVLSRTIYGVRVTMSVGLFGVLIALVIGVFLGAVSGYCGGWVDNAVQRVIEFMMSVPTIPIYLGLAAAVPDHWPPIYTFFSIVLILSLLGWTELARIVRGRFLALRSEEYVVSARLDGASHGRVIFRHMLPAMTSQIIASVTLAIPAMIIVEVSLSFLGLGLQPPIISWGVLLQEAQNLRSLAQAVWLFAPGVFIVLTVLAFNFIGDGLRDAADPYSRRE